MRITSYAMYNTFLYNQQQALEELNTVTSQLSSGKSIDKIYDDPTTYINALRLDQEENSLTQISSSASEAITFASQVDSTLSDFTETLESFNTNIVSAANGTHSSTSYEAIAEELEGLLEHLKDLANTSINGKFIFSGTMFDTQPIDSNGEYQGNDERIGALLGSQVETEYSIDGQTLFLGSDEDYAKHITLNVVQYDKMQENPQFIVVQDGVEYIDKSITANGKTAASESAAVSEPVTEESTIRRLTGVEDVYDSATDTYSDGTSYFYISGRQPNGDTFKEKLSISNGSTVEDLLEQIGQAYGNTSKYSAVDVTLNDDGQIEITDTTTGKMVTDFYMVASDTDASSINEIVENGGYIVEFNQSSYDSVRDISSVTANNADFDNLVFTFSTEFKNVSDESDATKKSLVTDVLFSDTDGDSVNDLNEISFTGSATDGTAVSVQMPITATTTMQDVMDFIETNYGDVDVSLVNGELEIVDNTISETEDSNFSISMKALDASSNSLNVFSRADAAQYDKTYFEKDGNTLTSNVSQIDIETQTYADMATQLSDVAGGELDGKVLTLDYIDNDGKTQTATITLRDTLTNISGTDHLSTFEVDTDGDGVMEIYDIYDKDGNLTPANDYETTTTSMDPSTCEMCTTTDVTNGISYQQLSDVISMIMSGEYPATNTADDYNTAVSDAQDEVEVGLNDDGQLYITDKNSSATDMKFALYDSDTDDFTDNESPVLTFNANNALTVDQASVDIFQQLEDIIDAVRNGQVSADGDSSDPRNIGIQNGLELLEHLQEHVIKSHTEIGAITNSLELTVERTEMLIVNTQTLKSEVLDTDIAEASLRLQQLTLNYEAMLSTISKVNELSLVNYL